MFIIGFGAFLGLVVGLIYISSKKNMELDASQNLPRKSDGRLDLTAPFSPRYLPHTQLSSSEKATLLLFFVGCGAAIMGLFAFLVGG